MRRRRSISPPLRRYSVANVWRNLCVDPEADPVAGALEQIADTLDVDRAAVAEQQEVRAGAVRPRPVHVPQELSTQPVAHRDAAELRAFPAPDLKEHGLPVVFDILQL